MRLLLILLRSTRARRRAVQRLYLSHYLLQLVYQQDA
jgi:hypothetical protein